LSKNVAVFVDVANIYYSARGQEVDVDYVALLKAATKGRDLIRAYAYSGLDPENENQRKFIDFLGKNGYKVVHKDIRKFGDGRMKANLDIELVVDLFRLADRMDIAVIVSGDGDFAPAIRALQDVGVRCEVISFRPNTSSDLIAVADEFLDMMKIAGIGRGKEGEKADKVMSAPPMPAKEVVPEFGFREAPAAVAAAALAALREGKEARPASRGRGRGRTRPEAPEPAAPTPVETAAISPEGGEVIAEAPTGEAHRRRRRRGGRGRGRGRGREETAAGEAAAPVAGEIGWVELDDISQIGDLESMGEPREYTFEEADAATLAELGLLPGEAERPAAPVARPRRAAARPAVGVEAETEAGTEPVKPRRGRSAKVAPAEPVPSEDAAPVKATRPRRSSSSKAAAAKPAAPLAETPKPRRSRAVRPKPSEAPSASSEGEPEGIWQRFRSGRATKS